MNEFLQRLSQQKALRTELLVSSLLINLLGLASSLYSIQVLNRYLALGVDATLISLTVGALIAVGFELALRGARLKVAQWLCTRADQRLSDEVFESSARGQYGLLEQLPAAARREIIAGQTTVQQCFSAPNLVTVLDAPFALVFLCVLTLISPFLAFAALLLMIAVAVVSLLAQQKLRAPMESQSRASIQLAGHQHSLTAGGEMVRAFSATPLLQQKWQDLTRQLGTIRADTNRLQNVIQNASYAGTIIMSMLIMGLGARQVMAGNLDVGTLIGANILASRALASMTRALGLGEQVGRGTRALELLRQLCSIPRERSDGMSLPNYQGQINLEGIAFAYKGQPVPVMEHFSIDIPAGSVVVVSGANGSGKTTFARLLAGLLEPIRGRIKVDRMDLRQAAPDWWRHQIAYLPQEPVFFDGTLRENLTVLCPDTTDATLLALCKELAIAAYVESGSEGLDMVVRNGGNVIPVGIRRRLALARALVGNGRLIVLDDPSEGVDAEGCKAIAAVLSRLAREGRTLIIMSNENFIISAADTVIDLNVKPAPRIVGAKGTITQGDAQ
jgi:ATP-binding cassette subfamily C protein LapB